MTGAVKRGHASCAGLSHSGGSVNIRLARAAGAALIMFGVARADAQITTVIAAPKQPAAKATETARRAEAAQDSIARVTLTEMKQWVDSAAAALSLRPDTGTTQPDSAAAATRAEPQIPPRPDSATLRRRIIESPPEFREGARAPNTATNVPTLALVGVAMILAGIAVRRRWRTTTDSRREP